MVWSSLAHKLVNMENHKYDSDYENSLIIKMFLFKFVNYYNTLFYVAFFKNDIDPCEPVEWDTCLPSLRQQFVSLFTVQMTVGLTEVIMPVLSYKFALWRETRGKTTVSGDKVQLCSVEKQTLLQAYGGTSEDYMELVIVFGYLVMFPTIFPLITTLAFAVVLLELRVDAFKLVKAMRLPYPHPAKSIGAWIDILEGLSLLGLIVNVGLGMFSLHMTKHFSLSRRLMAFMLLEHILLVLRYLLVNAMTPNANDNTKLSVMKRRMQAVTRYAIWGPNDNASFLSPSKWGLAFKTANKTPLMPNEMAACRGSVAPTE
eukprot:GHVR01015456.1.p1 GENE.GHVR01015456.1~~GHVR01015456.1.p1  ORF type:complete len:354 (+),score=48.91 GHVR01015456.1:119-1063(+)